MMLVLTLANPKILLVMVQADSEEDNNLSDLFDNKSKFSYTTFVLNKWVKLMSKMNELHIMIQERLERGVSPKQIAILFDIPIDWVFAVEANMPSTVNEFDNYVQR